MKILYLHQYFVTPDMPGGGRPFEMARRLVRAGHQVHVFALDQTATRGRPGAWKTSVEEGVTVHWLVRRYANSMSYGERLFVFAHYAAETALRAALEGGDIVFASSTPLTVAVPAIAASLGRRIPMVFEVRDLWPEVPIALGALRNPAAVLGAKLLERAAYWRARKVVALSSDMCDSIVAGGVNRGKVAVIPNGCDFETFLVDPGAVSALRARTEWLGSRPLILYAGALGVVNGLEYMVRLAEEALKIDPEVRFAVIGEGREEGRIRALAESAGVIGNNFFMLPVLPKSRIPEWFGASTVVLSLVKKIPALWKNSANKFFDGLATGRPIAINYGGWQARMVEEYGAGLVLDPEDARAGAHALLGVVRDSDWLERAGAASARMAREHFARDDLARQLAQVLEEAMARG
jgi:glycosyltransferase involved in cell wall biosynthesis